MTPLLVLLLANQWVAATPGAPRVIPLEAEPPEGTPAMLGARYALLPVAGRKLLVVATRRDLHVDGKPVRGGRLELLLPIGPGGATRKVSYEVDRKRRALSVRHALERRGEILLEGRVRPYALVDGNQDLRFDDAKFDFLRLDVDGDGEATERIALDEEFACGAHAYRFARGDPTGATLSFTERGEREGPAQAPDDPDAARAFLRDRNRARLRLIRREDSIEVLLEGLRRDEDRDFLLTVLADIPTEPVARELLRLRARGDASARDALLGQDDPRVVRALRDELAGGTISERRTRLRALFARGLERRAVEAVALDLLGDPDWEWRALALAELRAAPLTPAVARRVLAMLREDSWPARLGAAEALEQARMRDVVLPMIEALEHERAARVRQALGRSLYRVTGVHHGAVPAAWRRWWELAGGRFVVPLEAPPRDPPRREKKETGERRSVASFYGIPIDSRRVVFLIDVSGSMAIEDGRGARARFDVAVDELERAVRTLPVGTRANVIFFSDRIWKWKNKITELDDGLRASLRRTLESRRPRGETHLFDGFEAAFADEEADTIVILSDGAASGGKITEPAEIERAILDWNVLRRLTIHCVAIGYHSPMLSHIAEKSGGRYLKK